MVSVFQDVVLLKLSPVVYVTIYVKIYITIYVTINIHYISLSRPGFLLSQIVLVSAV